jgi:hypothetical protein
VREGEGIGPRGRETGRAKLSGPRGKKKRRKGMRWAGDGFGLDRFLSFFQILFKSISNPFKFKSFTSFQIQILTQISTFFKGFSQTIFNNFSNILNSNFHFLIQTFTPIFTIIFKDFFTNFFKTFRTTPQPNSNVQ